MLNCTVQIGTTLQQRLLRMGQNHTERFEENWLPDDRIALRSPSMATTWVCSLCETKTSVSVSACSFCGAPPPEEQKNSTTTSRPPSNYRPAPSSVSTAPNRFTWECRHCSLHNPFKLDRCEGCLNPRFGSSSAAFPGTNLAPRAVLIDDDYEPPAKRVKVHEAGM